MYMVSLDFCYMFAFFEQRFHMCIDNECTHADNFFTAK